ncbi:hypothetical protein BJ878DRAFT_481880 [Calycina marina]|uniref:Uncharacterized protein n=1 Tax=Calycina marina TaxID=1763456 RepID=A0A9P7YZ21_9HELO|nr:hypothetical protein BJ878DRAFT_481880 [Calycina marina]
MASAHHSKVPEDRTTHKDQRINSSSQRTILAIQRLRNCKTWTQTIVCSVLSDSSARKGNVTTQRIFVCNHDFKTMVIVPSGALETPLILERSDVGDTAILGGANIPLVAGVFGVGKEYSLEPDETGDAVVAGRVNAPHLLATNAPIAGWNSQGIWARSQFEPGSESYQKEYCVSPRITRLQVAPGFRLSLEDSRNRIYPGDPSAISVGRYSTASTFSAYPYFKGHVHITNRDPRSPIDFQPGLFQNPTDITTHV